MCADATVSEHQAPAGCWDPYFLPLFSLVMLSTEAETAVGVLKMNSRILEPAELKRLDKQEKGHVTEVQTTGKGKK